MADFALGKMLDKQKNKGSLRPYLANVNVRWGAFDLEGLREMRFEQSEVERFGLNYGDIVMCEGGEPGRCAIWKGRVSGMMIQKALHRIRPRSCLDHVFLFYSFLHIGKLNGFDQYLTGSTIKHLPREKLGRVEISFPPVPTQRRIAAILGAYDDLIEVNRRRIAVLEEMARRLFNEWFVQFRFPGHESTELVETENGSLPKGWSFAPFKALSAILSGFAFKSETFDEDGQHKLVTIKNIHDGRFNAACDSRISALPSNMPKHCILADGDICMSLTGNVGRVCMIYGEGHLLNQRVAKLQPSFPEARSYTYMLARSERLQKRLIMISNGVAQQNLSPIQAANLLVTVPPRDLFCRFSSFVDPMLLSMLNGWKTIANLADQRDRLLPRLISGELPVTAAEAGLERAA